MWRFRRFGAGGNSTTTQASVKKADPVDEVAVGVDTLPGGLLPQRSERGAAPGGNWNERDFQEPAIGPAAHAARRPRARRSRFAQFSG
jgi:hypothetical protein